MNGQTLNEKIFIVITAVILLGFAASAMIQIAAVVLIILFLYKIITRPVYLMGILLVVLLIQNWHLLIGRFG